MSKPSAQPLAVFLLAGAALLTGGREAVAGPFPDKNLLRRENHLATGPWLAG